MPSLPAPALPLQAGNPPTPTALCALQFGNFVICSCLMMTRRHIGLLHRARLALLLTTMVSPWASSHRMAHRC